MLSFNSLQSLISLLESGLNPDYVLTFNGWNEVDQSLYSSTKVSSITKACDRKANSNSFIASIKSFLGKFVLIKVFRRFFIAFINYSDN